jgi:uncharacterized membrane protein YphA (DoxX/SURF4 family)
MTTLVRFISRVLLVVVAAIVCLFLLFVCQGVFAGYPRYHTDVLSLVGLLLVTVTGGAAWIIDQRRIDAEA